MESVTRLSFLVPSVCGGACVTVEFFYLKFSVRGGCYGNRASARSPEPGPVSRRASASLMHVRERCVSPPTHGFLTVAKRQHGTDPSWLLSGQAVPPGRTLPSLALFCFLVCPPQTTRRGFANTNAATGSVLRGSVATCLAWPHTPVCLVPLPGG